jgi:hypothetical protein
MLSGFSGIVKEKAEIDPSAGAAGRDGNSSPATNSNGGLAVIGLMGGCATMGRLCKNGGFSGRLGVGEFVGGEGACGRGGKGGRVADEKIGGFSGAFGNGNKVGSARRDGTDGKAGSGKESGTDSNGKRLGGGRDSGNEGCSGTGSSSGGGCGGSAIGISGNGGRVTFGNSTVGVTGMSGSDGGIYGTSMAIKNRTNIYK